MFLNNNYLNMINKDNSFNKYLKTIIILLYYINNYIYNVLSFLKIL